MDEVILPNLEQLSIYQLRALGRQVGVCLPTTLKKQDLINKIRAIMSGDETPYVKKTNKGRPAKDISDFEFIKSQEEAFFGLDESYKISLPDLASYESIKPKDYANYDESVIWGLIETTKEGHGYLTSIPQTMSEPVYIKRQTVSDLNLETGDYVKAVVINDEKKNISFVKDIIEINGEKKKEDILYLENDYTNKSLKKEKVNFKDNNKNFEKLKNFVQLCLGDRVLFYTPEKKSVPLIMYDFVSNLNKNEKITDIVYLGLNLNAELASMLSNFDKVTLLNANLGDVANYQRKLIELSFKYIENLSRIKGKNVVFIVQSLNDILSSFDDNKRNFISDYCKRFFAKAHSEIGNSLTIVYNVINNEELLDEYETNENLYLKILPYKYLTNLVIKYNIIESHRTEFNPIKLKDVFTDKVIKYLNKGDSIERQIELETLILENDASIDISNLI